MLSGSKTLLTILKFSQNLQIRHNLCQSYVNFYFCNSFGRPICALGPKYSTSKREKKINMAQQYLNELAKDATLLKEMISVFPYPKNVIHNFYSVRDNGNEKAHQNWNSKIQKYGPDNDLIYQCKVTLNAPINQVFTGISKKKKTSETIALIKALSALHEENYMTYEGKLKKIEGPEKKLHLKDALQSLNVPVPINIRKNIIIDAQNLILQYNKEFKLAVLNTIQANENKVAGIANTRVYDFITGKTRSLDNLMDPNITAPACTSMRSNWDKYHIYTHKDEILEKIDKNQVVLIEGGTGCGKSTQVPQMVYEKCQSEGKECNIVITQPRRIAVFSLAYLISKERNEAVGSTVGYKMRLDECLPSLRNGIVLYTTGSFHRAMNNNKDLLGVTHVIVDEIHERNAEADILLLLLKELMVRRPNLKIILMSATIDVKQFTNYFGTNEEAAVQIPGKGFPIDVYNIGTEEFKKSLKLNHIEKSFSKKQKNITLDCKAVADVVRSIHSRKPEGAILVFLPKWADIMTIHRDLSGDSSLLVLPLHSTVPSHKQRQVFESPPSGQRKVILSTNIAETSLTIKDIVYVVDTGLHNSAEYNTRKEMSQMGLAYISQASAIQRAGRAGRVRPGEVYRLYSEAMFDRFPKHASPEITTSNLEPIICRLRSLLPEDQSISSFFDGLLDSPHPAVIQKGVRNLASIGILELTRNSERLTPVGLLVNKIPTDPHLAKSLIYGYFLRCLNPVTQYCALESKMTSMINNDLSNGDFSDLKCRFDSSSDILAMIEFLSDLNYFHQFNNFSSPPSNYEPILRQSETSFLINPSSYRNYRNLNEMFLSITKRIFRGPFSLTSDQFYLNSKEKDEDQRQLILGSFLTSSMSLYRRPKTKSNLLIDANGSKIQVHKCSILSNSESKVGDADVVICSDLHYSEERHQVIAREASVVNPLTVAMFFCRSLKITPSSSGEKNLLSFNNLTLEADQETTRCIIDLREIMKETIDFVAVRQNPSNKEKEQVDVCYQEQDLNNNNVSNDILFFTDIDENSFVEFHSNFVNILNKILTDSDRMETAQIFDALDKLINK